MKNKKTLIFYLILVLSFISFLTYDFYTFTNDHLKINQQFLVEEKTEITQKSLNLYVESLSQSLEKKIIDTRRLIKNQIHEIPKANKTPQSNQANKTPQSNHGSDLSDLKEKETVNLETLHLNPFSFIGSFKKKNLNQENKPNQTFSRDKETTISFELDWVFSEKKKLKKEFPAWFIKELKNINFKEIYSSEKNRNFFYQIKGPNIYPLILFITKKINGKKNKAPLSSLYLGLLPLSYFSSWNQVFKNSSLTNLYLINSKGFAFFHPKEAYVGSSLIHYPIVKKITKEKSYRISNKIKHNRNEESFSSSIQVENSNLYVVSETRPSLFSQSFLNFLIESLSIKVLGFLICFIIFYFLIWKNQKSQFKKLTHVLSQLALNKKITSSRDLFTSDFKEIYPLLKNIENQMKKEASQKASPKTTQSSSSKMYEKGEEKEEGKEEGKEEEKNQVLFKRAFLNEMDRENKVFHSKTKSHIFLILAHMELLEAKLSRSLSNLKNNENEKVYQKHMQSIREEIEALQLTIFNRTKENKNTYQKRENHQEREHHQVKDEKPKESKLSLNESKVSKVNDHFRFMNLKSGRHLSK